MTKNLAEIYMHPLKNRNEALELLVNTMHIDILGQGIEIFDSSHEDFTLPAFLLIYCLDASHVQLTHGNKTLCLATGDFYIFKPFRRFTCEQSYHEKNKYLYIYFDIYPISSRVIFRNYAFKTGDSFFQQEWFHKIGSNLQTINQICNVDRPDINYLLQYTIRGIIAYILFKQFPKHPELASFTNKDTTMIDQTFSYVEAHLSEPIQIGKIAASIGTSRSSLDRTFKALMHMSPIQVITRYKLRESIQLMNNGNSFKEIAKKLGYSSAPHFSRVFKSIMGCSPSMYKTYHK